MSSTHAKSMMTESDRVDAEAFADMSGDDYSHEANIKASLDRMHELSRAWRKFFEEQAGAYSAAGEPDDKARAENLAKLSNIRLKMGSLRSRIAAMMILAEYELPSHLRWSLDHEPVLTRVVGNDLLTLTVKPEARGKRPGTLEEFHRSTILSITLINTGFKGGERTDEMVASTSVSSPLPTVAMRDHLVEEDDPSGTFPAWLKSWCRQAMEGEAEGKAGYYSLGLNLAKRMYGLAGWSRSDREWGDEVVRIFEIAATRDHAGMGAWFEAHLGRFLAMVPPAGRPRFFAGFSEVAADGGWIVTSGAA